MNDHKAYYELTNSINKIIEKSVKNLNDEDLHFAYFLHYEDEGGELVSAIRREYYNRKEKKQ